MRGFEIGNGQQDQNGVVNGGSEIGQELESKKFVDRTRDESKKLWHIAGPVIITSVCQFSVAVVTVAFVGHLGELELAAVSIAQNVIENFAFAILLGMGSALETLCGQAFGAGQLDMLGVYMQRSWIIALVTAAILSPVYIWTAPILTGIHQSPAIANMAQKYCRMSLPQLFGYAVNFPLQKFFQSQTRVIVITVITIFTLLIHIVLTWAFVSKLQYGMTGAALAGNISWWLCNIAMFIYLISGQFRDTWTGFSWAAFRSLSSFVKLSLASGIMLCLELWYFTALMVLVGLLKNPQLAVDAISVCTNIEAWTLMIALGFNAAVSVRVSNELGAGRPKAAKFAISVAVTKSAIIGAILCIVIFATKDHFPKLFSSSPAVIEEAKKLANLLGITVLLNSVQPVLSGIAVGAGWQAVVAYINIGCYYFFGLPIGAILGFRFNFGVIGLWLGILFGITLQSVILIVITVRTNWQKEASKAEERIKSWGGAAGPVAESRT